MPHAVILPLLLLAVFTVCHGCLPDPASAYRFTGIVCRLTYPAAVVLNEKTTKVIEAAFQHARYPSMKGEKSLLFIGKVVYGLENLEIHNLSIGQSAFELRPGEGVAMEISNVSAIFKGTIQYGYGSWLVDIAHSVDFEVESQIDLGINPKLYCGDGKVAADTSDCYLNFHKLHLHLQGDKEPNWLKKLFTDFITFTVKLVVKGQICKEINKVANILADFIQDTAENFLSDGDIIVDISITAPPTITANYIESYHKGLTNYKNTSTVISDSVYHPDQLTENRMLYFWVSDQVFNPMLSAAHHDGRFQLNIFGTELACLFESGSPELKVWSSSLPHLNTSTLGTTVWAQASGQLHCGSQHTLTLFFQTVLRHHVTHILNHLVGTERKLRLKIGIPKALSVLEVELTRLLDKQGTNLFDISNPEVLPRDGFVVIQMDFGFPHHLLVEFLKKTMQ
uniref:Cholesteryl ester transfer protein n=1 Tax=Mastacembelus armatus TaxID=205130 RepID=A0A3Q3MIE3_9TELE